MAPRKVTNRVTIYASARISTIWLSMLFETRLGYTNRPLASLLLYTCSAIGLCAYNNLTEVRKTFPLTPSSHKVTAVHSSSRFNRMFGAAVCGKSYSCDASIREIAQTLFVAVVREASSPLEDLTFRRV